MKNTVVMLAKLKSLALQSLFTFNQSAVLFLFKAGFVTVVTSVFFLVFQNDDPFFKKLYEDNILSYAAFWGAVLLVAAFAVMCVISVIAKRNPQELQKYYRRVAKLQPMVTNHYLGDTQKETLPLENVDTLWKRTHLVERENKVVLQALAHPHQHYFNSNSRCHHIPVEHELQECSCGFYAYTQRNQALTHAQADRATPLLGVKPSGEVIEYQHGYRYQTQRVTHVIFPKCFQCRAKPEYVQKHGGKVFYGACLDHNKTGVTLEKFAERLRGENPELPEIKVVPASSIF